MLLSPRHLARLADDPRVPATSRASFRQSLNAPGPTRRATPDDEIARRLALRMRDFLQAGFGHDPIEPAAFPEPGPSDGLVLLDATRAPEVIGHELFHGVTRAACSLERHGEPGALDESLADVFGSMFAQWRTRQTARQAHWRIGPSLMGPAAIALGWRCVRDLAEPGSRESMSQQPASYAGYVAGGDAHDNCGIPSHAFYLAARDLGGLSWSRAGRAWYAALTDPAAQPQMGFAEFAGLTIRQAERLFPLQRLVARTIRRAWQTVGIPA